MRSTSAALTLLALLALGCSTETPRQPASDAVLDATDGPPPSDTRAEADLTARRDGPSELGLDAPRDGAPPTDASFDGSRDASDGPVVTGAIWYVDPQASGAKTGTSWSDAWQRFADIDWSKIAPGDGVYISGGASAETYQETLDVGASGSAGKPIVIRRAPDPGHAGRVIIDGQDTRARGISLRPVRHVTLFGFELHDHTSADIYVSGSSGTTYSTSGASSDIRIDSMKIVTKARGVFIQTSDTIVVARCTISTPTFVAKQTDGIYSQRNHDNVYEGNHIVIYNSETTGHDDGIQLYQDTSTVIRNNYIAQRNSKSGNAQGIYATTMYGTTRYYNNVVDLGNAQSNGLSFRRLTGTGTVEIYGNTVYSERAFHTAQTTETPDPLIKNNIFFTKSAATALDVKDWNGTASNIDYNLYWTSGRSTVASFDASSKTWSAWRALGFDAHGVNADPLVVDASNADFHLKAPSPAIDKGVALGSPYGRAKDGTARPQGAGWDIGAYER